jgi:hypothetical protein
MCVKIRMQKIKNLFTKTLCVVAILFMHCSPEKEMPEKWKNLGIPVAGIVKIYEKSDGNGLFADYAEGTSHEKLFHDLDSVLIRAGFRATCNEFDGFLKGYSGAQENLVVKIDLLGVTALSIFNDKAGDKLLYGVCFEGYKIGAPQEVK